MFSSLLNREEFPFCWSQSPSIYSVSIYHMALWSSSSSVESLLGRSNNAVTRVFALHAVNLGPHPTHSKTRLELFQLVKGLYMMIWDTQYYCSSGSCILCKERKDLTLTCEDESGTFMCDLTADIGQVHWSSVEKPRSSVAGPMAVTEKWKKNQVLVLSNWLKFWSYGGRGEMVM